MPDNIPPADDTTVATLRRIYADLHTIADDPVPAVRGPVRLALGEVAQILNTLGADYDLYSKDLAL